MNLNPKTNVEFFIEISVLRLHELEVVFGMISGLPVCHLTFVVGQILIKFGT